jgi:hypothetical protein
MNVIPANLVLITEGPDFRPTNWLSMFYYMKLFSEFNFDNLLIVRHAPRQSRYNPIELSWSSLSIAIGNIILCKGINKKDFKCEDDIKNAIDNALIELHSIWEHTCFNSIQIKLKSYFSNHTEAPSNNYNYVKEMLSKGKSKLSEYEDIL